MTTLFYILSSLICRLVPTRMSTCDFFLYSVVVSMFSLAYLFYYPCSVTASISGLDPRRMLLYGSQSRGTLDYVQQWMPGRAKVFMQSSVWYHKVCFGPNAVWDLNKGYTYDRICRISLLLRVTMFRSCTGTHKNLLHTILISFTRIQPSCKAM